MDGKIGDFTFSMSRKVLLPQISQLLALLKLDLGGWSVAVSEVSVKSGFC